MAQDTAASVLLTLWLCMPLPSSGKEAYMVRIPNSYRAMRNGAVVGQALGHVGTNDGSINAFGTRFRANGFKWTYELCMEDSDGDGQTNGFELGDPECAWGIGATPSRVADISHPGYADSRTSATPAATAPGLTATTQKTTTTTAPDASSCQASCLNYNGVRYACVQTSDKLPGTTLHWRVVDKATGKVDMALVKNSAGGWISLGFPSSAGRMVGGHAVVGQGVSTAFWNMQQYDPPYQPLTASTMRVPAASAASGTHAGNLILTLSGAKVADLTQVDLIFGTTSSCAWPCEHDVYAGYTINLLTGATDDSNPKIPVAVFIGAVVLLCSLLLFGPLMVSARKRSRPSSFFVKPLVGQLTPIALLVFALVLLLVCVVAISPLTIKADMHQVMLGLGLAAGVAALLPMLSIMKVGVHSVFGLSRELAFHVHAFFGWLLLVFGVAHGITAIIDRGIEPIAEEGYLFVGLIAVPTMIIGAAPGLAKLRYDWFKIVHAMAGIGYTLSLVHMVALTANKFTIPRIILTVANVLALWTYVVQRAYVVFTTRAAKVSSMEVATDKDGTQHIALEMHLSGFKYSPGQWVRLHIPRVGAVAHPFTVVPGDAEGKIRFIIKVAGRFTRRLANADLKDKAVRVEGPYGSPGVIPAMEWASAVAFVVGGVGVTPALALTPEVQRRGAPALVYWALRSERLFRLCAPSLGPSVDPALSHCHLSTATVASQESNAPESKDVFASGLRPASRKQELAQWLQAAAAEAERRAEAKGTPASLYVFVCGPPRLEDGVRGAAKVLAKLRPGLEVQVHAETFSFI